MTGGQRSRMATVTIRRRRTLLRADRWDWVRVASNGHSVAVAGEGYSNRLHAIEMALRVNRGPYRLRCGEHEWIVDRAANDHDLGILAAEINRTVAGDQVAAT